MRVTQHFRNKLTVRGVAKLTKPGVYSDGGGLYLRVRPSGTRSWLYIFMMGGRRREMGLGSALDISLAEAREIAREVRRKHKRGIDPIEARNERTARDRRIPTFGDFADKLIADLERGFRNPKHRQQWRNTVEGYGAPLLGLPIDQIDTDDILNVLKPIWLDKKETARRLRGRLERILDAAKARGYREGENPARWRGHLDLLLPKQSVEPVRHHAAMPVDDVPAFMAELVNQKGVAALALRWTILNASRTSETLGMKGSELDVGTGIWAIGADRMKAGVEHQVPISPQAVDVLLEGNLRVGEADGIVFRSPAGGELSNMAMAAVLRRMRWDNVTVHGFRSTFRDWAGDRTDFARDDIELCLAHTISSKTERAYRRSTALDKRREIMTEWAIFCLSDAERRAS